MSYYTYVLKSLKNGDIYIGSTDDVYRRVSSHNQGKVKSTKGYRPWELLEHKGFGSRSEAVRKEKFLKNHQQKEILKRKYGLVAKR
jgi:putative endonuclease